MDWLRRFPLRKFIGFVAGCLTGLFSVLGVTSFSFPAFALLKAVYTPLLAYAVARWVILRQISAAAA